MEKLLLPSLLLIAGTGRNSGKTSLACLIVRQFSRQFPIITIKVSPHFHENVHDRNIICSRKNLHISEENDFTSLKDSSRLLQAGARKSYFIMAADDQLPDAVQQIMSLNRPDDLIICESGGLFKYVTPGIFLLLNRADQPFPKSGRMELKDLCDRWVTFDGKNFDFSVGSLGIRDNKWTLIQ
jgi:hypothetical protein